jgi:hypothetical protein
MKRSHNFGERILLEFLVPIDRWEKSGGGKLYVLHEYVCFTCSESERKVDSCRHLGWPCSLSRTVVGGGPDDPRNTRRERCLVYPPKRKMTRIGSVHGGDGPGLALSPLLSCPIVREKDARVLHPRRAGGQRADSFFRCVRRSSPARDDSGISVYICKGIRGFESKRTSPFYSPTANTARTDFMRFALHFL